MATDQPTSQGQEESLVPFAAPRKSSSGFRFSLKTMLIGVTLISILLAIVVPMFREAREAAYRNSCGNNMKQIMLALHNYHDTYKTFPPAYIPDANGKPMHSWRVVILPFIESAPFHDFYDWNKPWNSPNNKNVLGFSTDQTLARVYSCPSVHNKTSGIYTNYVMVVGPNTFSSGPQGSQRKTHTDGTHNTVAIIEIIESDILCSEPRDLSFDDLDKLLKKDSKPRIGSRHAGGGAMVGLGDGSVRYLEAPLDIKLLKKLLTINDGEPLSQVEEEVLRH